MIKIIRAPISKVELKEIAKEGFGDFVKAVVDIEQGIMAVGGELHADLEALLMENESSKRENTWGINLYVEKSGDDFIQFDSMVNIKLSLGNRSRKVEDLKIQSKVREIIKKLVVD